MGEGETLGKGVWGSSDRPLRSVWGAAGSDTQVPEAPEAPSPAKRSPKLGERWEAGRRKRPFSSGTLGGRLERRTGGQGTPRRPHNLGRTQGSGSQLLLGSGVLPSSSLPVFLSGYPPNQNPPHAAAGKGRSQAPLQPTPCSPDEGAKGEMGGVVGVRITDPFIKGKSENPKKIMIKRCANDDAPPHQRAHQ